jgi:hypothetical protein
MAKSKRTQAVIPKGNYRLNQSAPLFNDRRTKRNRDRSTQNRQAIERSKEIEKT